MNATYIFVDLATCKCVKFFKMMSSSYCKLSEIILLISVVFAIIEVEMLA